MEWPLTIAAVVFLGAYAWPILDPGLPTGVARTCSVVGWAVREENDETGDQLDDVQAELLAIHQRLDRVLEER